MTKSRAVGRLIAWFGLLGAVLSVLLHLTVRDRVWPLSTAFYAMPCWMAFLGATAAAVLLRQRRLRRAGAVFAIGLFVWSVQKDFRPFTSSPEPDPLATRFRLLAWNPFFGQLGWEEVAETVRRIDADVVCLVEGGSRNPKHMNFWREQLPNYEPTHCGFGYCILSKYPARVLTSMDVRPADYRVEAEVKIDGRWIRFVQFHPKSKPLYDRTSVSASLAVRAEELSSQPTIICGDFNMPTNSAHLDPLREKYVLASDAGAATFRPTWPMVFPVLTLDQIWCGGGLRPVDCDHLWTLRSDHRPVVAEIELPP